MKEFDVSGFINELNSILRDEKNKKPVRITIKRCKLLTFLALSDKVNL